ncbi:MAG: hypothetical protein FGM62_06930 [Methylobacterium sp.]|nr:hypothetical protein [Methylobacterium sp.]
MFGGDIALAPVHDAGDDPLLLALAAPNAINSTWLAGPGQRFGGVSGDATGQGPFSVWHSGKGAIAGHCEVGLQGAAGAVGAAHGVRILCDARAVTASHGHDLIFLGGKPALDTLHQACNEVPLPMHRLMAGIAGSIDEIAHGHYRLTALVGANEAERSVTLARKPEPGQLVFWALRETGAAQQDLDSTVDRLLQQLAMRPQFGLLFSCLGRGPYFYSGVDRDLELLQKRFPGMPLIGFYGNGEIAPVNGVNELLQYSAVLGLFGV